MSETSRQSLKAYLQLQTAHKELHKVLKTLEDDSNQEEILRRFAIVESSMMTAKKLLT